MVSATFSATFIFPDIESEPLTSKVSVPLPDVVAVVAALKSEGHEVGEDMEVANSAADVPPGAMTVQDCFIRGLYGRHGIRGLPPASPAAPNEPSFPGDGSPSALLPDGLRAFLEGRPADTPVPRPASSGGPGSVVNGRGAVPPPQFGAVVGASRECCG